MSRPIGERPKPLRCVALFTGGLDSMLAIRLMQLQGVEVLAAYFSTPFTTGQADAAHRAELLGAAFAVIEAEPDYVELVRRPRLGQAQEAAPCLDCRIAMLRRAKAFMEESRGHFLVSGEVLGDQRGQKRRELEAVAIHAGVESLLVRPLSAKLLSPSMPERAGWIDRNRLGDFSGSGRRARLDLARWLAVPEIPENAGPGCRLTAPGAAARLHDLIRFHAAAPGWELELLTCGRHFRFHESTKVVLGRREEENLALGKLYRAAPAGRAALISPQGFPGPTALVSGVCGEEEMAFACGLLHRFAKLPGNSPERTVAVEHAGDQWELPARQHAAAEQAVAIS